jgi:ubiquinone/menaquinone biosynthesis C-methylase UbiE
MNKLNIGCGWDKKEGFINIDKAKEVNPDQVIDIEQGLPFPDNHFDYIFSEHALEHIRPQYWSFVLSEIARVSKNDCVLELILPFDQIAERTNADHYRVFSWDSFSQFCITDTNRAYYSPLRLERINKNPPKIVKWFFYMFPFLNYQVHLIFKVKK